MSSLILSFICLGLCVVFNYGINEFFVRRVGYYGVECTAILMVMLNGLSAILSIRKLPSVIFTNVSFIIGFNIIMIIIIGIFYLVAYKEDKIFNNHMNSLKTQAAYIATHKEEL